MADGKRKKKRIKGFLLILMMLVFAMGFSAAAQAKAADPQVVKTARKNKVSKGKWVKKGKKLRYKKKNKKYIKSQWCMIGKDVYYFDAKGYVKTGMFSYKGCYYYADSKGRIYRNRLLKKGGKVYYFGKTGVRVAGKWQKLGSKTYYFDRQGAMVTNSWVGNSYVGKNGAMVVNKTVNGRKIDKSGEIKNPAKTDTCIFVGASRVVDMSIAVKGTETIFLAKGGEGYKWLKDCAAGRLNKYLKKNPRCTVIFMLGNNDPSKANQYIKYYRNLMKKYPKASFYFVNALPKSSEQIEVRKDREIFNQKMTAAFGSRCISAEEYLKSKGRLYDMVDGTHYYARTSRLLYQYIMKQVKVRNSSYSNTYDLVNQTGEAADAA